LAAALHVMTGEPYDKTHFSEQYPTFQSGLTNES
jgi:hypothetical protein